MRFPVLPWLIACLGAGGESTTTSTPDSALPDDSGSTETEHSGEGLNALCINEIMEDNRESLTDETGATPSWIELHNPERSDVSLAGWSLTDDTSEPDRHVFEGALTVPGLGFLVLYADDETSLGPEHLGFELNYFGGTISLYGPEGQWVDAGQWIDEWNSDMSRARDTDCCMDVICWSSVRGGTPGESNLLPEVEEVPLFAAESAWRYHDQGVDLGTDWREPEYDDSSWAGGLAPLGYGDDHQVTELSYGSDADDKHPTTYFRTTFEASDVDALDALRLELMVDDGASVYLNGTEVLRVGLPGGELDADTYATRTASGSGETDYTDYSALTDALVSGVNVLAVEVHQAAPTSSDLGMDLAVVGEVLLQPR